VCAKAWPGLVAAISRAQATGRDFGQAFMAGPRLEQMTDSPPAACFCRPENGVFFVEKAYTIQS
jgi:hypothetical protein